MMIKYLITALLIVSVAYSQPLAPSEVQCLPTGVVDSTFYYIGYMHNAYKYSLPDLNLATSKNYGSELMCTPASLNSASVTFSNAPANSGSNEISTADLTLLASNGPPASYAQRRNLGNNCSPLVNGEKYCFSSDPVACQVQHFVNGVVTETTTIPCGADNASDFVTIDEAIPNRLHVTTKHTQGRGANNYNYYRLTLNPLTFVNGPVELPHTASPGCPVQPQQCSGPNVVDFHIQNDIVSYVWTAFITPGVFDVTVVAYDAACDQFFDVAIGSSSGMTRSCGTTTTTAPETTTAAPETTTAVPETTTSAPETTTAAPETTTAVTTTTSAPETTAAPVTTTVAPTSTGAPPTTLAPTSKPMCAASGNTQASNTCLKNQSGANLASRQANVVCSGNGSCDASNICACKEGFTGVDCDTPCEVPINLAGDNNALSSGSSIASVLGLIISVVTVLIMM